MKMRLIILTTLFAVLTGGIVHGQDVVKISVTPTLGYSRYTMGDLNDSLASTELDMKEIRGGITYGLRLAIDNGNGMLFIHPESLNGSTAGKLVNTDEFLKMTADINATAINIGAAFAPLRTDDIRSWIGLGYTYYIPSGRLSGYDVYNGETTSFNWDLSGNGSGGFIESRAEYTHENGKLFKLGAELTVGYRIGKFDAIANDGFDNSYRMPLDYSGFYGRLGLFFTF
jgi:hypothetical protein